MQYFRGDPLCTDQMWRAECASVAQWCQGKGLDPGAGQRTLYPDTVRVDVRPENMPDYVQSADHLCFADSCFDFVFNSHLLEHLPDTQKALREWLRVVKLGGYVCCIIPNTMHTLGQNTDPTPHLHEWTPRDFAREVFGCEDISVPWFELKPQPDWCEVVYFGEACPQWSFAVVLRKN